MKKIKLILGLLSIIAIVSCKKKEEMPIAPPPPPTMEMAPPPPPPPPAPVDPKDKDGTSIELGKDGVNINTTNGEKQTTVKVANGETRVEVKK